MKRTATVLLYILVLIIFWSAPAAHAEDLKTYYWEQQVKPPSASWPQGRTAPLMAYNEAGGYVLMFGGWTPTARLQDTWKWQNGQWTELTPATKPSGRSGGGMVYDAARQQIVMFGGEGPSADTNDTWVWDDSTNNWVQKSPAHSPAARGIPQMAYDPLRENVVLFGGKPNQTNSPRLSDTWVWDGTDWTQKSPATTPTGRSFGQMAFDGSKIVMFGGETQSSQLNDTWSWNGTNWTALSVSSASPSARHGAAFAYDPDYQRVILFGGISTSGTQSDAWVWDGAAYAQITPNVTLTPRNDSMMVYDTGHKQFVLFGGYLSAPTNETWTLTMLPTVAVTTAAAAGTTTATAEGTVTDEANSSVSDKGFVYSYVTSDPKIGGANTAYVSVGDGLGSFSANLTGLTPGKTYYLRAYATNAQGTAYGSVVTFTTQTLPAPVVTSVDVPDDGLYGAGQVLTFTVNTSGEVSVTGQPQLAVNVGGQLRTAVYTSTGSTSTALKFQYTVQAGDADEDGIGVGTLSLNGGTIKDVADNALTLTLQSVADTTDVLVDGTAPTVDSVVVPTDGTYVAGEVLTFLINVSEAVDVTGSPQLTIDVGGQTRSAAYSAVGSTSTALKFLYTVQAGDADADGIEVGALSLNGGTISDGADNALALALEDVADTTNVLVDGVVPTVGSVDVPVGAAYGAGQLLMFKVNVSEAVEVTGSPQLTIDVGGQTRSAAYSAVAARLRNCCSCIQYKPGIRMQMASRSARWI